MSIDTLSVFDSEFRPFKSFTKNVIVMVSYIDFKTLGLIIKNLRDLFTLTHKYWEIIQCKDMMSLKSVLRIKMEINKNRDFFNQHFEEDIKTDDEEKYNSKFISHSCNVCQKVYESRASLSVHIKSVKNVKIKLLPLIVIIV